MRMWDVRACVGCGCLVRFGSSYRRSVQFILSIAFLIKKEMSVNTFKNIPGRLNSPKEKKTIEKLFWCEMLQDTIISIYIHSRAQHKVNDLNLHMARPRRRRCQKSIERATCSLPPPSTNKLRLLNVRMYVPAYLTG